MPLCVFRVSSTMISVINLINFFGEKPKLLERGEDALKSNHLQSLSTSCTAETGVAVVNAEVFPSMKKGLYKVSITVENGKISEASCDCPMGKVICHHMACVAIYCQKNLSPTDLTCSWKRPKPPKGEADFLLTTFTLQEIYPAPYFIRK